MPIDLSKEYRTDSGCEVKLDRIGTHPLFPDDIVHGYYRLLSSDQDAWAQAVWDLMTGNFVDRHGESMTGSMRLVEADPRPASYTTTSVTGRPLEVRVAEGDYDGRGVTIVLDDGFARVFTPQNARAMASAMVRCAEYVEARTK